MRERFVRVGEALAVAGALRRRRARARSRRSSAVAVDDELDRGAVERGRFLRDVRDRPAGRQLDVARIGVQLARGAARTGSTCRSRSGRRRRPARRGGWRASTFVEQELRAAAERELAERDHGAGMVAEALRTVSLSICGHLLYSRPVNDSKPSRSSPRSRASAAPIPRRRDHALPEHRCLTTFADLGLRPELLQGRRRAGLHHAHADPGPGDPARARGPRRHGRRADRHRQDRRLHAAAPAAARAPREHERLARAAPGARADPHADARARRAGGGERPRLRQVHPAAQHADLRRRADGPADRGAAPRRRDPGRDAGPAPRSRAAAHAQPVAGRDLRARRGRPHARHGVHPRRAAHRRRCSPRASRTCSSRPRSPSEIRTLADSFLRDPVAVQVAPKHATADLVTHVVAPGAARDASASCSCTSSSRAA